MKNDEKNVENCVLACRKDLSITQQDLADAVGVTRQTIIAIEKGNYAPSIFLALKIAQFFQKPVEKVFYIKA